MTDKLSPTVTDAMIEAGVSALERETRLGASHEQACRRIYAAMHSLSASGDVERLLRGYDWIRDQLDRDCKAERKPHLSDEYWEGMQDAYCDAFNTVAQARQTYRDKARAALTASGNSGAVSGNENKLGRCPECGAPPGLDCRTIQGRIPPHETRLGLLNEGERS
jgi:hypothetical protein